MKRILVAPLNWGLGHSTRCIPIIKALLANQFEPVLASDGEALKLLKKEFEGLEAIELPSYNIRYASKAKNFKLKLLQDSPRLLRTIAKEKAAVRSLVKTYRIDGIISDNRFGVRDKTIPSVFITHQLKVLSGSTTWLTTAMHQNIISKFDACWVPDNKTAPNLSGALGHAPVGDTELNYIGPLSRFTKKDKPRRYHLMVLLSGPKPQRTLLEDQLLKALEYINKPCLFIRGKVEDEPTKIERGLLTIYNYLTSTALEEALNTSDLILCRSGYTTLMDLAKLEKKAFFIPTPGQFEQEYLAEKLEKDGIAPYATQDNFKLEMLSQIANYKGFGAFDNPTDFKQLFSLF